MAGRSKVSNKKIIAVIVAAILLVALFGVGIHFIEKLGLKDQQFGDTGDWGEEEEQTILEFGDKSYVSDDDVDAYLIIGTDAGGEDLGEAYKGELADFLTLLLIDNTTQKFAFMQIDRNSMMEVQVLDEEGDHYGYATQQICLAHWYGLNAEQRNENTVEAVSRFFGNLNIDNYYTINMADMDKINNAIGGVVVDIDTDMTNIDPAFVKGESVLLTDGQAEKFVRARKSVGSGSNRERMARQTQYMQKAYNLVMGQLRENPEYINELYDSLEDTVQSDNDQSDLSRLANHILQYESLGILQFEGEAKRGDTQGDGIEHEEFYTDQSSILANLRKVMDLREMEE